MNKIRKFLKSLGPGFITGASDDDPSGIGTYSQTGARFGYTQLWTVVVSFPLMVTIQEMCGRIGLVTGRGLSGVIKEHYSKKVLYFSVLLLVIANTVNIGADLGAMASSFQLVVKVPFFLLLLAITTVTVLLEIFVPYKNYAKFLKYLTLSLFAYVATVFIVKQDWSEILRATLIPNISLTREYLLNIVAIFGTTISPYLFFWQADEEVEEEINQNKLKEIGEKKPHVTKKDVKIMQMDTFIGMLFSNLVALFIIITTASTLSKNGITNIETAHEAAAALQPVAGDYAFLLFTIGIIGTGLLAVPILAGSASYAVSEAFNLKAGLEKKFYEAKTFYWIIVAATIVGIIVNFLPISPFKLLYYTAVLNGLCAPPLMILIMLISNNKKIMGSRTNNRWSNTIGWIATGIMGLCTVGLIVNLL